MRPISTARTRATVDATDGSAPAASSQRLTLEPSLRSPRSSHSSVTRFGEPAAARAQHRDAGLRGVPRGLGEDPHGVQLDVRGRGGQRVDRRAQHPVPRRDRLGEELVGREAGGAPEAAARRRPPASRSRSARYLGEPEHLVERRWSPSGARRRRGRAARVRPPSRAGRWPSPSSRGGPAARRGPGRRPSASSEPPEVPRRASRSAPRGARRRRSRGASAAGATRRAPGARPRDPRRAVPRGRSRRGARRRSRGSGAAPPRRSGQAGQPRDGGSSLPSTRARRPLAGRSRSRGGRPLRGSLDRGEPATGASPRHRNERPDEPQPSWVRSGSGRCGADGAVGPVRRDARRGARARDRADRSRAGRCASAGTTCRCRRRPCRRGRRSRGSSRSGAGDGREPVGVDVQRRRPGARDPGGPCR